MAKTTAKRQTGAKQRQRQPATHYKLGEKDHARIIEGLTKFVPVYVLARSFPCDYHTLLNYIHKHPELSQCQRDADDNMVAFAKGKLMQKVSAGNVPSILFLLERLDREHFGRYAQIENVGDLPAINIGLFKDDECPEPLDPSKVAGTAAEILKAGAELARKRQAEIEAEEDA